jgi:hypothetical protein
MAARGEDRGRRYRWRWPACPYSRCGGSTTAQSDPVQHLGANGRARVDGDGGAEPDTVEQEIKRLRAQQLALSNAALEAAAAARSGRYTLADDARQEIGRAVAQVLAVVDSALAGMANAVVAAKPTTPREALRVLRASWRASRERAAKAKGAEAATMKALIEDDQLALVGGQNV